MSRSGLCYEARADSEESLRLMLLLDEQYTRTPFYGIRRMKVRHDLTLRFMYHKMMVMS
jgi:putative transposase